MRSSNRPLVVAILFGTVLVLDLATSAAAAGPSGKAPRKERPQEAEVRIWVSHGEGGPGGIALPAWLGAETQLSNPGTQTTCTMRVRRGRTEAEADLPSLPLRPDLDPGIVRSISPCVPERAPLGAE